MTTQNLNGVFAAAVTPLQPDGTPDLDAIPHLMNFLSQRGCHGALLLGTTGEGPSFSIQERRLILQAALTVRQEIPTFRLLAGTGTPSLDETIQITRMAFEMGMDGVVVLPPYYYRKATDEGLFLWFREVIQKAVPAGGALLGYHIPAVSGVPLSLDLLERLKTEFPDRFTGLKDSSGDPDHARRLGERFGKNLTVFTGNDRLFSLALDHQASGCITALANISSPDLRQVWDGYIDRQPTATPQERLQAARQALDRFPPAPAVLKVLLARYYGFPHWSVRLPLVTLPDEMGAEIAAEFSGLVPLPALRHD